MTKTLALAAVALLSAVAAAPQTLVIERNSNLRPDASSCHPALRLLKPPVRVELLDRRTATSTSGRSPLLRLKHYWHTNDALA